ncbi:Unconventional myosin-XV [Toxocara canis]|uniref:Unconventional myosin-XV n=1 Tax=Toxocara canis TaxID=6265 RepID=A0A0B2UTZ5_TOXCA|nr:Unconventional myosin-XV [Toxocara canis]
MAQSKTKNTETYDKQLYNKGLCESIEGVALRHLLPLELSRVVYQKQGERNFNVFYQMCAGLEQSLRQKFGLKESHKYFYLNQGKCVDNESEELEKFADLREAFKEVGFTDDQQSFIFRTLATILHIGNLFFRPRKVSDSDEQMGVEIGNDSEIKWSAYLLEVDFEQWSAIFTSKTMTIGEETASAPLTINQALDVRDSLAQLIYDELFHWIMTRISCAYQCPNHSSSIALLDYYGFERYNNNMFEQFCVNLVSERFESFYVQKIFKEVKYDYEKEEIEIDYQMPSSIDNERITELLFKRPDGLLPLLDDECKFPKASDESYLQRCNLNHLDKSIYGKARAKDRLEFAIKHFAGQTFYSVQQFIEKNRRQISKTAIATMAESQNTSVAQIFRNHTFNGKVIAQDEIVYVAQQYNRSTKAIVEKMSKSVCHFVRCLRSNSERQAGRFCEQTVVRQLHSLAVLDTIKIRRHGYPIKQHFDIFAARYRCLLPADVARCQTTIEIVNDVLEQQGNKFQECFRIGKTAVCLKERIRDHLENIRERTTEKAAITIQKHIRMMIARREYLKKRKAAIVLQSGLRGWKARRIVEQKRAETRKAIDLETRQARRMNVYADAEADKGDAVKGRMQSLEASVAGVQYLDLPEQVQKRLAVVPQGKCAEIRTVHYYTPFTTKIGRPQIALISLEEFAERSFKGHLVEARREPIATPFLPKDTEEEFNEALLIFKLILRYMNDTQLSNEQLVILAKHIMQKGIDMPEQRDEIYVQICNQTYRNRVKANAEKAWTLMLCACNSFPPSIHIFPMLMHYFQTVPQNLSSLLIDGLLRRIRNKETSSNRMLASTVLEQSAFKHQQPAVLRVRCPHDQEVDFEADSWMTSEELAKKFLRTKGIGEPEGWSISVDDPEWTIQGAGNHYVYDVIAQFEEPGAAMNDGPFVAFINKGNFKPSQPSTKRTNNSPKGASTMVMAQRSLPRMRRSSLERKTEVSKPPTPPPHHMQAYSERRRDTKIHLGEQIYGNDEQRPPLPQHQSLVAEGLSSSTLNRRYTNGTIDRKVRMQDGCETLPNGVAAPIYGRISNNEIYQRGALDRREPRMRSEFDQSMLRPIEQPQSPPDGQTMKRYRRQQQQFSEIERHDPRPQFAYVPQQFAMPVMPAQVQFMPFMLPTTSFVPQRAVETWPQEPVRNEKSNREKVNTSVVMNDDRVYREKQPEQRIDDLHGESRTEIYGRASSRTPIGSQNTRDEQRRPPSDYSTMSISSRIRRMQIPSKNSDVDKFLDAVFEQVLPPHELERSDERAISTSVIAASIKGGLNGPVTASEREMRIVDNDGTMQSAQSVAGQYVQPGFVNYAAQPVMMMMPVDGRMFMQQQQQTINSETIPDGRSVSQMTSVSSAIQPVPMVIPSIIPSNVMMCISPTPGALSCLSPVPIKSEQVDELPQDNDRTLSPTPMVYSPVVAPNNFRDRSSPLPESAQSPTNLDENSRLGQLNPTSIKARYVGPTHPETNEGLRSPDMPRRVTSSIKQIQQDAVRKRPQPVQLNVRGYRNENPYYSNTTNFVRYESPYGQHSESIPPPLPQRIQMDGMQQVQNGSGLSYRSPETVSYYQESPVITHQHSVHYNLQPTYSPPPRETKGLQRLSQDEYREPVIVGDTLNSERLQPGKLPLPTPVPQTYEIERDAIRKLKEKARHLPPPVDETRFVRPAPKKEVIEIQYKPLVRRKEPRNEQREVTVNEPKESPAPLRPPPRVTYQSEEPEASQIGEWVYESDVLRSDVKESRLRAQQLHGNLYARGVPAVIAPMPSDSSSSPQIANIQKNLYEKSAPPKQREKPAVQYVKQPWTLTIRKELFFPYEQLDDVQEIDLVFSQIIADCRKQIPYRIRNYERDAISQILRSNNVPPAALDHPEEIAVEVKMHIIETVRKWPLYFCRLYAVVEERENDSVNRLLGVGESGVRLISRNIENTKEPLSISDHFE